MKKLSVLNVFVYAYASVSGVGLDRYTYTHHFLVVISLERFNKRISNTLSRI